MQPALRPRRKHASKQSLMNIITGHKGLYQPLIVLCMPNTQKKKANNTNTIIATHAEIETNKMLIICLTSMYSTLLKLIMLCRDRDDWCTLSEPRVSTHRHRTDQEAHRDAVRRRPVNAHHVHRRYGLLQRTVTTERGTGRAAHPCRR